MPVPIIRKLCILSALLAVFSGCSPALENAPSYGPAKQESFFLSENLLNIEPQAKGPKVYKPKKALSKQETIEEYIEQQYLAYSKLEYTDLSYFLDMDQVRNQNCLIWLKMLIQRRRLLKENGLCYVDTKKYNYKITYQSKPVDNRMTYWKEAGIKMNGETFVHFTIKGQTGKVYPPFMALNTQHTVRMRKIDGVWKITFHYYPGSPRKFSPSSAITLPSEKQMLADLKKEFKSSSGSSSKRKAEIPEGAFAYDGERAAGYAKRYTESRNPNFYTIGDWMGNCANFTSQCLWYGFGSSSGKNGYMAKNWTGTRGGGTAAWENVRYFWSYATASYKEDEQGIRSEVVKTVADLKLGGILQTKNIRKKGEEIDFGHSYILVDEDKLLLSQNSPDCYMYYSDLVNVEIRMLNPLYIIPKT